MKRSHINLASAALAAATFSTPARASSNHEIPLDYWALSLFYHPLPPSESIAHRGNVTSDASLDAAVTTAQDSPPPLIEIPPPSDTTSGIVTTMDTPTGTQMTAPNGETPTVIPEPATLSIIALTATLALSRRPRKA